MEKDSDSSFFRNDRQEKEFEFKIEPLPSDLMPSDNHLTPRVATECPITIPEELKTKIKNVKPMIASNQVQTTPKFKIVNKCDSSIMLTLPQLQKNDKLQQGTNKEPKDEEAKPAQVEIDKDNGVSEHRSEV